MTSSIGIINDLSYKYGQIKQKRNEYRVPSSLNDSGSGFINDKGKMNLISAGEKVEMSNWHLPPKYIESFNHCDDLFKELAIKFGRLQEEQQKRITPKFNETENRIIDNTISGIVRDMTATLKEIEDSIRIITFEETTSPQEQQIKENMRQVVINKLNDYTKNIKTNEEGYLQKFKELNSEDTNSDQLTNDRLKNDLIYDKKPNSDMILQRNRDLANLLNSITSLSQIYKDLQALIMHQGTILDRIDFNIDQTKTNVIEAHEVLKEEDKQMQSSLIRWINLCLAIIISIMIILLIFKVIK